MIANHKVLALIPARSGSKGLIDKNIKPLLGMPLLAWPIKAALNSQYVDKVIISTDSQQYADIAKAYGADVPFIRPDELASDTAPSIGFILHALDHYAALDECYDYLVLLEPTSPLTQGEDVDKALEALVADKQAEAIVGVNLLETMHPAFTVGVQPDGLIEPLMAKGFEHLPRRQDLEPVYHLDGSLYISAVEALYQKQGFCHDKTLPYIGEKHHAFEIDDDIDFVCIEAIASKLNLHVDNER